MNTDLVWYASYGSNMSAGRFNCYLAGGNLPSMAHRNPGARDPSPPLADRGVDLPGGVYFALESKVWGGGMAFLDPHAPGTAAGRAYLITLEQFSDVVAQEMRQSPGTMDIDLTGLEPGNQSSLGPGRYETLVHLGHIDGAPLLTFTAPERQLPITEPSGPYLCMLATGLADAHGWNQVTVAQYLANLPGCEALTVENLEGILREST